MGICPPEYTAYVKIPSRIIRDIKGVRLHPERAAIKCFLTVRPKIMLWEDKDIMLLNKVNKLRMA